jgi:lysophospholipase L1-like esterase
MRPKPTSIGLLLLALALIAGLLAVFFIPIPRTVRVNQNGASGSITASPGYIATVGECVQLRWNVEGIESIRLDGVGTIGVDEREVCIQPQAIPTLNIGFTDGTTVDFAAPVIILVGSLWVWGAGLLAVVLLLAAAVVQLAPEREESSSGGALGRAWNLLVSVVVGVLVTALLLEGVFRLYIGIFGTERDQLIYTGTAEDIAAANSTTIGMPFVNFGGIPGELGINARGFRGESVEHPKPDGIYRILALGGSTTYGLDVAPEDAYPGQLQRILREDYGFENVEVVNAGFPSYTTMNSLVNFITRGVEVEPDLAIVYHANNDLVKRWDHPDCFAGDNPINGFGGDPGYWDNDVTPLNPSVAVRWVQINFGLIPDPASFEWQLQFSELCDRTEPFPSHLDRIERNSPAYFERNLRHFAYVANGAEVDLLLLTQAYDVDDVALQVETNDPLDQWASVEVGMAEHNGIVRELADELEEVYVYDFEADWEPNPDLWNDYIHLNEAGLRLQAEMIAAYIAEQELIDAP